MRTALSLCLLLSLSHQALADQAADMQAKAHELTQKYLLVDTHIDVPFRLTNRWQDVATATDQGDFDIERANAGGLNVPFMSIYTPAQMEDEGKSWQVANQLIDHVEALAARAPKKFAVAHSTADVLRQFKAGQISLAMGMENGGPLEGKLENLQHFYDRGIRYITLAHSKSNHISDSSYDENRRWGGLSEFGRSVVKEMNRLGIMIDVSHLSDDAARQAIELSAAPVIASHSSARHFTPDWERNMSDELIGLLAKHDGVLQINFGSTFLTRAAQDWSNRHDAARTAFMEERKLTRDRSEVTEFSTNYRQQHPYPYADVSDVADHFDHVVKLVGIDHVGIGSDYDGVGDSLPTGLKDVAAYPNLIAELLKRGYPESQIEQILGGNLMRVWEAVEKHAAAH